TTGTYEVKVTTGPGLTASSVNYTLVAVSNGSFEANGGDGSFATAQDISGRPGARGAQRQPTTTFVAAGSGGANDAAGPVFAPDGSLLVSSQSTNSVLRYDATTGAFLGTFVAARSGGLTSPIYLTFGPDGNLYVSSRDTNSVLRYNGTTGAFLNAFVSSGSGGLNIPQGLAFGPDRNLYPTHPPPTHTLPPHPPPAHAPRALSSPSRPPPGRAASLSPPASLPPPTAIFMRAAAATAAFCVSTARQESPPAPSCPAAAAV